MWFNIVSNKGAKLVPGVDAESEAVPALPEQYTIGLSNCSSVALRSIKSSYTSSKTSARRASGLSTLFIQIIIL